MRGLVALAPPTPNPSPQGGGGPVGVCCGGRGLYRVRANVATRCVNALGRRPGEDPTQSSVIRCECVGSALAFAGVDPTYPFEGSTPMAHDKAYETIIAETQGRVGLIRLNRPNARNALNARLIDELSQALDA